MKAKMTLLEAIQARHSVRTYKAEKIGEEVLAALEAELEENNRRAGLSMQLRTEEPEAFQGLMARMGGFENVNSYIALVAKEGPEWEEKLGYRGQKLVLLAQQLGLNSCWVAATYNKGKSGATVGPGEKLHLAIALGYGQNQGRLHKNKDLSALYVAEVKPPEWFLLGMRAAQLAPTAMNRQSFRFALLEGNRVAAEPGKGGNGRIDLGIAKLHFEIGAGEGDWRWA